MKKLSLIILLVSILSNLSFSQENYNNIANDRKINLFIGANISSYKGTKDYDLNYSGNVGLQAGIVYNFKIIENLLLGSGIIIENRGANYQNSYISTIGDYRQDLLKQSLIALNVPLNIIYAVRFKDDGVLKLNIGPYGTYFLSGKQKAVDRDNHLPFFNTRAGNRDLTLGNDETNDLKRFDFGSNIGLRYYI